MNLLLQVFFSLHVSLSEVCAFYSKENIFYILLTVDFFVVNIFCIFIYKSHKKNSNVQLYTLNLQLEENKVNSVVSGLKCPPFLKSALPLLPFLGWGGSEISVWGWEREYMTPQPHLCGTFMPRFMRCIPTFMTYLSNKF